MTLPATARQDLLAARELLEEVQKLAEEAIAKALPNSAVTDLKVGEGCSAIFTPLIPHSIPYREAVCV